MFAVRRGDLFHFSVVFARISTDQSEISAVSSLNPGGMRERELSLPRLLELGMSRLKFQTTQQTINFGFSEEQRKLTPSVDVVE